MLRHVIAVTWHDLYTLDGGKLRLNTEAALMECVGGGLHSYTLENAVVGIVIVITCTCCHAQTCYDERVQCILLMPTTTVLTTHATLAGRSTYHRPMRTLG